MSFFSELKADTHRQYGRFDRRSILLGVLTKRTFRVVFTLRICQAAARSGLFIRLWLPFFKVLHKITTHHAAMDLSWQTDIGPGFALTHGWGLVVNAGTKIGKNVTLFHGVTLGQRDRISKSGERVTLYPTLEDEVWVGPNAIIVGGVTIGRGSRIAGGAFVTEDVPPYSIVVGNPANIVKSDCIADVKNPVLDFSKL